jgi:phosphatidylinositol glycan class P protein
MTSSNRGGVPPGLLSKSTPNLPTLKSLDETRKTALHQHSRSAVSPPRVTSPRSTLSNGPASVEDNGDQEEDPFALEESDGSESGEEEAQEEVDSPPASRPLYTSRSYTHLPRQPATALYPPFYNRPPVPLPPSPSLTSLLRPAFSAATSRPTTPDSSDVELPSGHTNGTTRPRRAPPISRTSPTRPAMRRQSLAPRPRCRRTSTMASQSTWAVLRRS